MNETIPSSLTPFKIESNTGKHDFQLHGRSFLTRTFTTILIVAPQLKIHSKHCRNSMKHDSKLIMK